MHLMPKIMEQYFTVFNNGKIESHPNIKNLPADAYMMLKGSCFTSVKDRKHRHQQFKWEDMENADEITEGAIIISSKGKVLYDAHIYQLDMDNVLNGHLKAIIDYKENEYFDKYTCKFESVKSV